MIDEAKLNSQRNDGARAEAELRLTAESFKDLRTEYGKAWEKSDPRDTAGREKLWLATTILTQVEEALRTRVANGKVAQADIDAIRKAGEPKPEKPLALREFRRF